MSKLSKLMGKPVVCEIDGEKFELYPLKLDDLELLMQLQSKDELTQMRVMKDLIRRTLKASIHDATEEELDGVSATYFEDLSYAVMKANGLDDVKPSTENQKTSQE